MESYKIDSVLPTIVSTMGAYHMCQASVGFRPSDHLVSTRYSEGIECCPIDDARARRKEEKLEHSPTLLIMEGST